jgi:hypothetical protein
MKSTNMRFALVSPFHLQETVKPLLSLLAILFFITAPTSASADTNDDLSNYINICSQSSGAFYNYRTLASVPPVIGGELARTTFADICDLLVKVYNLNNHIQNLAAKVSLVSSTKRNWETDLLLTTAIGNVVASKYYGEAEPTQVADIEDRKEDQDLKDFYATLGNDDRVSAYQYQDQREAAQNMDAFERAARQKSMLSEALVCPDNSSNPNYRSIFEKEIQPLSTERERYRLKRNHYLSRLNEIGPTFLRDDGELKYSNGLRELEQHGVIIQIVTDKTQAKYFEKKNAATYGEPARVVSTNNASVTTQKFYSTVDSSLFEKFKADWKARWKDFADHTYSKVDTSLNVADDCLPAPGIPEQSDLLHASQLTSLLDFQKRCETAAKQKADTPSAFSFEEALDRYLSNSKAYAALQAQIWTKESALLKKPIMSDVQNNGAVSLDNRPNCQAEPMSDAKIVETKAKLLETENEFKEIIAKETIKDSMLRDEELRKQQEAATRAKLNEIHSEQSKNNQNKAFGNANAAPDLSGSF